MRFLVLPGDVRRNFGDTAICLGVVSLLRALDRDASIAVACGTPLLPGGFEGVAFLGSDLAVAREARRADLVAWGGGQLLAGNRSRAKVPLWVARIGLLRALGARIVGVAQGIGPLPRRSDARLAARAVGWTAAFSVRDEESRRLLVEAGVPEGRVRVTADPALLLAPAGALPAAPDRPPGSRPALGLSFRWTAHHRAGRVVPFRFQPASVRRRVFAQPAYRNFAARVTELATRLASDLDVDLRLFPTYRAPWESDEPLADAVADAVRDPDRVRVVRPVRSLDEMLAELRRLDFFVGMPMHSTILSTSQGVPTLALPYEAKGSEYFELLGMPEAIGPRPGESAGWVDRVRERVATLFGERERLRAALAQRIPVLRERALSNLDVLRAALG
jgi:polysaccharide pyruvyl transferase WcaK-like protein